MEGTNASIDDEKQTTLYSQQTTNGPGDLKHIVQYVSILYQRAWILLVAMCTPSLMDTANHRT